MTWCLQGARSSANTLLEQTGSDPPHPIMSGPGNGEAWFNLVKSIWWRVACQPGPPGQVRLLDQEGTDLVNPQMTVWLSSKCNRTLKSFIIWFWQYLHNRYHIGLPMKQRLSFVFLVRSELIFLIDFHWIRTPKITIRRVHDTPITCLMDQLMAYLFIFYFSSAYTFFIDVLTLNISSRLYFTKTQEAILAILYLATLDWLCSSKQWPLLPKIMICLAIWQAF